MSTGNLFAVQNDSGMPLILRMGGATPPDAGLFPAFTINGKPLLISIGNGFWEGNGETVIATSIAHGLGISPIWVDCMGALNGFGQFYPATIGQYAAADDTFAYVAAFSPASLESGVGNFTPGLPYFFNWIAVALAE